MAQNNKAMSLENTKQYIKGILQGWFSNKATLDKLSTATNGDLLYDNQPVGSGSGSTITVDDALSGTSENPVQNKVIYAALQNTGSIPYTLPPATTTDLGGIIVGDNLTIDANGRLSADEQSIILDIDEVDRYDPDTNELVLVDADGDVTRRIDLTPTGGYGSNVVVDDSLSDTSENPVQNKVVKAAIDSKADASDIPDVSGFATNSDLDAKQDVLAFDNAPTENSTNPVTSGGVYAALQNVSGGGSGGSYQLPIASSSVLGGIKVGAGLGIDSNGYLYVVGAAKSDGFITLSTRQVDLDPITNKATVEILSASGDIVITSSNPNFATSVSGSTITITGPNTTEHSNILVVCAENGMYTRASQKITVNKHFVTYSAIIDMTKADPEEMVTYADDAVGVSKGYSNWKDMDIFKELREGMCILKDGEVLYYLNPDDLSKKVDGTGADITTLGNDVMLEISRLGYYIEWLDENSLKVSVTNDPNNAAYNYDAFSLDSYNDCDRLYIGVYKAYMTSGTDAKMYSSSGKTITQNNIVNARTFARAKGHGYQQRTYASLKLMQCLYLIAYGTLDSQSAVGAGLSSVSTFVQTGGTNAYGFSSELIKESNPSYMTDGKHQVKCLGIEDFWGNIHELIDGIQTDSTMNILTARLASDFNDTGNGYINNGNFGISGNVSGYITMPIGGSQVGFLGKTYANSITNAKIPDYGSVRSNLLAYFGGAYNGNNYAGAFSLMIAISKNTTNSLGARLCYLHKEV